jgi:sodium pump decarboxylase gamma subunit
MTNLQVGLQLTVVGMSIVFFVLLLLMYTMKLMSSVILKFNLGQSNEPVNIVQTSSNDQELAAVMAIAFSKKEDVKGNPVQVHLNRKND